MIDIARFRPVRWLRSTRENNPLKSVGGRLWLGGTVRKLMGHARFWSTPNVNFHFGTSSRLSLHHCTCRSLLFISSQTSLRLLNTSYWYALDNSAVYFWLLAWAGANKQIKRMESLVFLLPLSFTAGMIRIWWLFKCPFMAWVRMHCRFISLLSFSRFEQKKINGRIPLDSQRK